MKILFFINSLQDGGGGRVITIIGNNLAKRKHEVFIVTNTTREINFNVDKGIVILPFYTSVFNSRSGILKILYLLKYLRGIVLKHKPDIVVGVMSTVFLIVKIALFGLSIPIIASDHTSFERKISWKKDFIRLYLYRRADAVTILTQADYNFLGKRIPKKVVIPNPLAYPVFTGQSVRRKNILAAGRLNVWKIKGFDILIEVWGRIAEKYPEWTLDIAGTGDDISFEELKSVVSRFKVENRVNFLGFHKDIDKIMQESSIFVLSSRVEGFGLVLIEAMSQGCACISFDSGGRQKEIITSSQCGIIIENHDKDELEKSLIRLIEDDKLRMSISEAGKIQANRFSKEIITDRWELLFKDIKKNCVQKNI